MNGDRAGMVISFLAVGQGTSQFGNSLVFVASLWIVYAETRAQGAVSLLGAVGLAPTALAFLGGWVADQVSRRTLLVLTDLARFLWIVGAWVGLVAFHLPVTEVLVGTVLVTAAGGVLFGPALDALLPSYASGARLVQANGILSASLQAAAVLGGLAAGVLIDRAPRSAAEIVLAVDASSFLVSLGSVLLLPPVEATVRRQSPPEGGRRIGWREGVAGALGTPLVAQVVPIAAVANVAYWSVWSLLPMWVDTRWHGSGASYGVLQSVLAAGSVLGGLLVAVAARWMRNLGAVFAVSVLLEGVLLLIFSWTPWPVLGAGEWLAYGLVSTVGGTVFFSALQTAVRRDQLGRVLGAALTVITAASPAGAALSGPALALLGLEALAHIAGLLVLLCGIALFFIPSVRGLRRFESPDD